MAGSSEGFDFPAIWARNTAESPLLVEIFTDRLAVAPFPGTSSEKFEVSVKKFHSIAGAARCFGGQLEDTDRAISSLHAIGFFPLLLFP